MSAPPAVVFVTCLWHYLVVARLLYEELVRPLSQAWGGAALLSLGCAGAFVVVVAMRRRVGRPRR